MDKEVKELIDAIRSGDYGPQGLKVSTEGAHAKIFYEGEPVYERLESGEAGAPLTLPTTPSDSRWYENTVQTLIRSSVLREDPRKADQRGLTEDQLREREEERERKEARAKEREQEVEAERGEAQERQSNTTVLRQRAERLFEPIGVWKPSGLGHSGWRGTIAEVARVHLAWAERAGLPDLPRESAGKNYWRRLFRDETVDERGRAFLVSFVDYLDRADNPSRLYHDELRKLLGIGETRGAAPAARPGPKHVEDEEGEEPVASVREVVDLVGRLGRVVTSADIREGLPDMASTTRSWATWKAGTLGLIQRVARGKYAPVGFDASAEQVEDSDEPEDGAVGEEEPEVAPEEDDEEEAPVAEVEVDLSPIVAKLDDLAAEVQRLQQGRGANGSGPPTLALEALAEMIGQHITVGGGEEGGITDDVFALIDRKRERAMDIAARIAALETGTEVVAG